MRRSVDSTFLASCLPAGCPHELGGIKIRPKRVLPPLCGPVQHIKCIQVDEGMFGHHLGIPSRGIRGLLNYVFHYCRGTIGCVLHNFLSFGSFLDEDNEGGTEEAKVENGDGKTKRPRKTLRLICATFSDRDVSQDVQTSHTSRITRAYRNRLFQKASCSAANSPLRHKNF